eukprot:SAG11_NODE_7463_length_1139_cov_2.531731_1_plen_217_part_00
MQVFNAGTNSADGHCAPSPPPPTPPGDKLFASSAISACELDHPGSTCVVGRCGPATYVGPNGAPCACGTRIYYFGYEGGGFYSGPNSDAWAGKSAIGCSVPDRNWVGGDTETAIRACHAAGHSGCQKGSCGVAEYVGYNGAPCACGQRIWYIGYGESLQGPLFVVCYNTARAFCTFRGRLKLLSLCAEGGGFYSGPGDESWKGKTAIACNPPDGSF